MPKGTEDYTLSVLRDGGMIFSFEILNPGELNGEKVTFPAFIDSISDSFSPSWASQTEMGRADPKTMYQSFSRSVAISFKVVALSNSPDSPYDNTEDIYARKLNTLAKAVYPQYTNGVGFVGRYIKFTIGKLYVGEYGYISSLSVNIDSTTPWHVDYRSSMGERPIVSNVSMTINWIGDKRPDADKSLAYSDAERTIYTLTSIRASRDLDVNI